MAAVALGRWLPIRVHASLRDARHTTVVTSRTPLAVLYRLVGAAGVDILNCWLDGLVWVLVLGLVTLYGDGGVAGCERGWDSTIGGVDGWGLGGRSKAWVDVFVIVS